MVVAVREVHASGYALEIDGRFNRPGLGLGSSEGIEEALPVLQVRIYDALTRGSRGSPASASMSSLQTSFSAHAALAAPGSRVGVDGPLPPHCVAR
jgi:hypothetical protein